MPSSLKVAVIPGDGIGPEVTSQALAVMSAAVHRAGARLQMVELDVGSDRYLRTGRALEQDDIDLLSTQDAVLLGALGDPRVRPGVLERGVIVALRRQFRQSVNLRPVQLLQGVESPLKELTPSSCDFVVVRENTEGLYAGGSSSAQEGTVHDVAVQTSITTYAATRDVVLYAFELARRRRRKLAMCHKTNILVDAGRIWTRVTDELRSGYPDVEVEYVHADAMTLHMVQRPESFDVVVTDNLFGDILSDLGAAIAGGLGVAASANLNLDGSAPSMFEPVHGSAPDLAGKDLANPAAAILSGAMLLEHLGLSGAGRACREAVGAALLQFATTGRAMRTREFGQVVTSHVEADAKS